MIQYVPAKDIATFVSYDGIQLMLGECLNQARSDGDVWYLLATLYCKIGDGANHLDCCSKALDTYVKDIFTYCEHEAYSKIFPAMTVGEALTFWKNN